MPQRNFMDLLHAKWDEGKFVCVGLDSDAGKLPILHLNLAYSDSALLEAQAGYRRVQEWLLRGKLVSLPDELRVLLARAQTIFNQQIVAATADTVCAYKINSAFYEAFGGHGWSALDKSIAYINEVAPDVPVILDCKRGDIDNTNVCYVMAAVLADAVTVHPYLGFEAMKPFLDQKNKGVIVLVRTSNKGAGEFQDLEVVAIRYDDTGGPVTVPLYAAVAGHVASSKQWNYNGNCCVVAGATYPAELAAIRAIVGDMPILIPGIGKQGGDLEATVRAGVSSHGQGMIINNSRGVIFAGNGADFAEAARAAALKMHEDINAVLATV